MRNRKPIESVKLKNKNKLLDKQVSASYNIIDLEYGIAMKKRSIPAAVCREKAVGASLGQGRKKVALELVR